MTDSFHAVFLSYASQDAETARCICEALRAANIEVWFDQSELRGGDAWDAKIRKQIKECALFVPIISANTQARREGYFRLEWRLAAQRTHMMAEVKPFLVPVCIDDTRDADAHVPEEFRAVQWTRLANGVPSPEFAAQVKRLLEATHASTPPATTAMPTRDNRPRQPRLRVSAFLMTLLVLVAVAITYFLRTNPTPATATSALAMPAKSPSRPTGIGDHSIAVLAFTDLSEAKNNEYFADGISEELLNVLAKVPGLRVAARTSSFSFKGQNRPIPEIAEKLRVAYVVEGSVRRAGDHIRITAQLIQAADGFHVWSDNFNGELKDIFAVQDEVARLIAKQLSLQLGTASAASTAPVNPEAVRLYLEGRHEWSLRTPEHVRRAETLFTQAIALEPKFARAHSGLVDAWVVLGETDDSVGRFGDRDSPNTLRILERARQAVSLDPESAEAHASLGVALSEAWQSGEDVRELRRAIALNPNYASAHQWLGRRLMRDGWPAEGEASLRRACELDPLSSRIADNHAFALWLIGRTDDALVEVDRALALMPDSPQAKAQKALFLAGTGRREETVTLAREVVAEGGPRVTHGVFALAREGLTNEAERALGAPHNFSPCRSAHALAALGRWDDCLAALQPEMMVAALGEHLLFNPIFDPIRQDPRFIQTIAVLGLSEAQVRANAWRAQHPAQLPVKK